MKQLAATLARAIRKSHPELNYNQSKDLFKMVRQQLGIKPTKTPKGVVKRLRPSQLEKLLNAAYAHSGKRGLMLQTLYETACRVSEFCDLEVTDFHIPEQTLVVRSGKGNKRREIPLTVHLTRQLQNHIGKRDTGAIFRSDRAPKYSTRRIQQMIKATAITAEIHEPVVTPHILRHTRLTDLTERGMPQEFVQKFAGHESPATTQIYTASAMVDLKKVFLEVVG